jgi:cAMP-specific phosphodiesterase 4
MQAMFWFNVAGDLSALIGAEKKELTGMLVGAMVHDVEHPGTNNLFQVMTRSAFATRYNDKSVLEAHHVSAAFCLMQRESHDLFGKLDDTMYKDVRKVMIDCVLATDMAFHFEKIGKLKTRMSDEAFWEFKSADDRTLLMSTALHAADISNPTRPLMTCLVWTERVLNEFWAQGDRERKLGLQVGPLNDRTTAQISKGQVGFISVLVAPLFEELCRILPAVSECVENMHGTVDFWKSKEEEMDEEMKSGKQRIPYPEEPKYGSLSSDEPYPRIRARQALTFLNDQQFAKAAEDSRSSTSK